MAHIKTGGTTKGNRDAEGKRLGVKVYGGHKVIPGIIIIRHRGTKFDDGPGVGRGKDYTLYALKEGEVFFKRKQDKTFVEVRPSPTA